MKGIGLRTTVASCVIGPDARLASPHSLTLNDDAATRVTRTARTTGTRRTPIKHVIYIIGENRTFDHGFATFVPRPGQTIGNLLSEGIIRADGSKGPNWSKAQQWEAVDSGTFSLHPRKTVPFGTLPPVNTDGAPKTPHFPTAAAARDTEPALPYKDYFELTTGGTGLNGRRRRHPVPRLAGQWPVPDQPVHLIRLVYQQPGPPLLPDVAGDRLRHHQGDEAEPERMPGRPVALGRDDGSAPAPTASHSPRASRMRRRAKAPPPWASGTCRRVMHRTSRSWQTSTRWNDNFHQAIEGGTGANHVFVGYGTAIFYADANGNPTTPPSNQIENPNAQPGTNNW